jgi:hypothetical protein
MRVLKARRWYLVGAGLLVALIGAAFAYASHSSIPNSSGEFYGCYVTGGKLPGQLRVIDYPSVQCRNGETLIHWSASGPSGPSGPSGATGPSGPTGPAGPASSQVVSDNTSHYCFNNGADEGPCETGDLIDGGVNCPTGTTLFGGGVEIHAYHGPINDVTPVVGEAPNFTLISSNAANYPTTGAGNGWVAGAVILNHNETDYYDVTVTAVCSA